MLLWYMWNRRRILELAQSHSHDSTTDLDQRSSHVYEYQLVFNWDGSTFLFSFVRPHSCWIWFLFIFCHNILVVLLLSLILHGIHLARYLYFWSISHQFQRHQSYRDYWLFVFLIEECSHWHKFLYEIICTRTRWSHIGSCSRLSFRWCFQPLRISHWSTMFQGNLSCLPFKDEMARCYQMKRFQPFFSGQ